MNRFFFKRSAAVVLAALFVMSGMLLAGCGGKQKAQAVYMVYFGLNDADTGVQAVDVDEAAQYIRGVVTDGGYGYTEYRTHGAYVEDGVAKENETLVYMLTYIEEPALKKICADVKAHLHLDSIFYSKCDMVCGYAE